MNKKLIHAGLAMLYLITLNVLFSSCEHKELCYHHPHTKEVRVEFDWRNAPEAAPKGMCVFFYPMEEGISVQRFDFNGREGGKIDIMVGRYRVICHNNDAEAVLYRGTDRFDTYEFYTREGNIFEPVYGNGTRSSSPVDEPVVICPDMLWGCCSREVEITDSGIRYTCVPEQGREEQDITDEQVITLYPCEQVCTYTYEIRNVRNLEYANDMCASLSGMSGSLAMPQDALGEECLTLPFAAAPAGESLITGGFYTFGHHPDNTEPHKFRLFVWGKDGKNYYYTYDVTDQVHQAADKRRVHIIIDGLDFPEPIGGSGFDVNVDGWEEVKEEIKM